MDHEHWEQLLREPDNLFGPPTGRGYDYLGVGILWPFHLAFGWAGAAAVGYATLCAAASPVGLRRCGRLIRVCTAVATAAGWVGGRAWPPPGGAGGTEPPPRPLGPSPP